MDSPFQRLKTVLLDPRIVALAVVIGAGALLVVFLRKPLTPFFLALVLAYFLDAVVAQVQRWKGGRGMAVGITFAGFLVAYLAGLAGPVQLAVRQVALIAGNLPAISARLQELVRGFFQYLSGVLSPNQQGQVADMLAGNLKDWGEAAVAGSLASIGQATSWAVYLLLVPLLVFFFLKDKAVLLAALGRLLPRDSELVERVWRETEGKLGNYVRGKVWEILIVGTVTSVTFILLGFRYAAVMGLVSGLSVVIPFVGAFGAALPVLVLGYAQWGAGWELGWLMIAYVVIQVLDGNLLAPLIFSEAVKLHPVFILLAVFVFGALWGFWGVFFAIPLATLAKSVLNALFSVSAQERPPAGL